MLGVVASVLAMVCKPMQQLPTTRNNMRQGVLCKRTQPVASNNVARTDATLLDATGCVRLHGAKDISLFSDLYGDRAIPLS